MKFFVMYFIIKFKNKTEFSNQRKIKEYDERRFR